MYYCLNWFVKKYGVPKHGERGFSAAPSVFCHYFIEDFIYENKK